MEKSESVKIEEMSLRDLARIQQEAKNFGLKLVLIGGYATRAYTKPDNWRFTKDMDFIVSKRELRVLYGVLTELEYGHEETEFGIKGSRKIGRNTIELHISVDRVIDWSTGGEYALPRDVFDRSREVRIKASFDENKAFETDALVAPIEDVVIMKLMTERPRDQFDAVAMLLDSFDKFDLNQFSLNCKNAGLSEHVRNRIERALADIKKGVMKKLWREYTGKEFIREQEASLKKRIKALSEHVMP